MGGAAGARTRYPWGDEDADPERLNYALNIGRPTPVGIFPAGATSDGMLDLSGNVWEWCLDRFGEGFYQDCDNQSITKNPAGPQEGGARVLRGGSWIGAVEYARAAYRYGNGPDSRGDHIGFRLCCASHIALPPSRRRAQRGGADPELSADHGLQTEVRGRAMAQ